MFQQKGDASIVISITNKSFFIKSSVEYCTVQGKRGVYRGVSKKRKY
jgi:hypothetical protein